MTSGFSRRRILAVAQAIALSCIGVLPAFLIGALAGSIRNEFPFGLKMIGISAATLFGVAGVCAAPAGRFVQRIGYARGHFIAAILSVMSLATIALALSSSVLLLGMVLGGAGNAIAQPTANLRLSRSLGTDGLGLALGIKQSAAPVATLLAGLTVPGVALLGEWRWAPGAGAVVALMIAISAVGERGFRTKPRLDHVPPDRGIPRAALLVFTLGCGLGASASTSLGVFLIGTMVDGGVESSLAGFVFAGCSVLGLVARVGLGRHGDRNPRTSPYFAIARLLACGAVGCVLLGTGNEIAILTGAPLAYILGWSWPGIAHLAVIRDNRVAAANTTGILQTGFALGSAAGPLSFGVVAHAMGFHAAWLMLASLALLASILVWATGRMIRRSRSEGM